MANEFDILTGITGQVPYACMFNGVGGWWDSTQSAFVSYVPANRVNYSVALAEVDAPSGYYVGNIPARLTPGRYWAQIFLKVGASPAASDPVLSPAIVFDWDGVKELGLGDLSSQISGKTVLVGASGPAKGLFSIQRGVDYAVALENLISLNVSGLSLSLASALSIDLVDPVSLQPLQGFVCTYGGTANGIQTVNIALAGAISQGWIPGDRYRFRMEATFAAGKIDPVYGTYSVW